MNPKKLSAAGILGLTLILVLAGFLTACGNPTSNTEPESADTAVLEAKIAEAEQAKAGIKTGESAANVAIGIHFVTTAEMTAFNNAINSAKSILNNTTASQSEVDAAVTSLDAAIGVFNTAKGKTGTKTTGFTTAEIDGLVASADTAIAGVFKSSDNGNDISPADVWVPVIIYDALRTAIDTADKTTPAALDTSYIALSQTLAAFETAKKAGTTPDKSALNSAIGTANAMLPGLVIADSSAEVYIGKTWATGTQKTALDTALTGANTAKNNNNATVNAVNAALTALTNAINAITTNAPGVKKYSLTISGLSAYADEEVRIGLFASSAAVDINAPRDIYGFGMVTGGAVSMDLLAANGQAWAANGTSWYIGLFIGTGNAVYAGKNPNNFSSTPEPVLTLASFSKVEVFSVSFNDLTVIISEGEVKFDDLYDFLSKPNINMGDIISLLTNDIYDNYSEWKEEIGFAHYKNQAKTTEYKGSDIITGDMIIYTDFPIMDMSVYFKKLGEIIGCFDSPVIIPDGAWKVIILTTDSTGGHKSKGIITGATWSIPLYDNKKGALDDYWNIDTENEWHYALDVLFSDGSSYKKPISPVIKFNFAEVNINGIHDVGSLGPVPSLVLTP